MRFSANSVCLSRKTITEKTLNERNEYLHILIDTYLALGKDVHLSYNSQDFNEVRTLNPCSVLLDYAEDFFNDKKTLNDLVKTCSYYDDNLSSLTSPISIAINNNLIE